MHSSNTSHYRIAFSRDVVLGAIIRKTFKYDLNNWRYFKVLEMEKNMEKQKIYCVRYFHYKYGHCEHKCYHYLRLDIAEHKYRELLKDSCWLACTPRKKSYEYDAYTNNELLYMLDNLNCESTYDIELDQILFNDYDRD